MANELSKIKKLTGNRTDLIDKIIEALEGKAGRGQDELLRKIIDDIIDRMDRDGDSIKNTLANKRILNLIDKVFNDFENKGFGLEISKNILDGVGKIIDFNGRYFGAFTEPAKLGKIFPQVKEDLGSWLGIDNKGRLQPNGYLQTLIADTGVRNQVKKMVMDSIISQEGYTAAKSKLRDFISGDSKQQTGALKRYYRNFVYDTFSQVDRTNAKLFADRLALRFAIYEGGIIKTSREFCIDHNGKVFHYDEIAEFDITEARPPGYNPFTDLGGYGCRHHLNWIPDALAYALRPELRTLFPPKAA